MRFRSVSTLIVFTALLVALAAAPSRPQPAAASFPGQNGLIAYTAYFSSSCEIYTVDPVTEQVTNVTNTPECEVAPAWSADGAKLAISRNTKLWVMNADGSDAHPVGDDILAFDPVWSPDGEMLAYEGADLSLYVISVTGGQPLRLASAGGVGLDGGPAWSPDGSRIAFVDGGIVALINPDGTDQVTLTSTGNGLSWSPDGRCIIMNAYPALTVVDVTTGENAVMPVSGEVASWSPDGTQISFTASMDGTQNIYVANLDGTEARQLTNHTTGAQWSDWQPLPDGQPPAACDVRALSQITPTPSPTPDAGSLPRGGGRPVGGSHTGALPLTGIVAGLAVAAVAFILIRKVRIGDDRGKWK